MIKKEELRIGNSVKYYSDDQCKIFSITSSLNGIVDLKGIQKHSHVPVEELEAIPLTKELLIERGFKEIGVALFIMSHEASITSLHVILDPTINPVPILVSEGHQIPLVNTDCLYLHQLENLYYFLCGKELVKIS